MATVKRPSWIQSDAQWLEYLAGLARMAEVIAVERGARALKLSEEARAQRGAKAHQRAAKACAGVVEALEMAGKHGEVAPWKQMQEAHQELVKLA